METMRLPPNAPAKPARAGPLEPSWPALSARCSLGLGSTGLNKIGLLGGRARLASFPHTIPMTPHTRLKLGDTVPSIELCVGALVARSRAEAQVDGPLPLPLVQSSSRVKQGRLADADQYATAMDAQSCSPEIDDVDDDDDNWEGWAEPEVAPTKDLFSTKIFDSAAECLTHAHDEYGLDLAAVAAMHRLDIYGRVKLVNYVRALHAEGKSPLAIVASIHAAHGDAAAARPWEDDRYLMPVTPDDPLLYSLGSPVDGDGAFDDAGGTSDAPALQAFEADGDQADLLLETIQQMRTEMVSLLGLNEAALPAPAPAHSEVCAAGAAGAAAADVAGSIPAPPPPAQTKTPPAASFATEGQYGSTDGPESEYFASYAKLAIHEQMLSDHVRTQAYKDAIEGLGPLLSGKAVLDVGCGTAILSMIAAQAGAARVVGVDASEIIVFAQRIVAANQLVPQVTLLRGTMETLAMPADVPKVDIIVSEWMGYALLYESMLPTVLFARDRYLKPGGLMLPSACEMCLAASSNDRLGFWGDVYGFDMACIADELLKEASIEVVPSESLISSSATFATIDVTSVTDAELDFCAPYRLVVTSAGTLRCFVLHFDTIFDYTAVGGRRTSFTTSSEGTPTHWKQTALYLKETVAVNVGDVLTGKAYLSRGLVYKRGYDITLDVEHNGLRLTTQCWRLQ